MKKLLLTLSISAFIAGCSNESTPHDSAHPSAITYYGSTENSINGAAAEGLIGGNLTTLLNAQYDGLTYYAALISRSRGERSPIQHLSHAVTSCVLEGQATLVIQGQKPSTYTAGHCYYRPAGTDGYVVNKGKSQLKLLFVPQEQPPAVPPPYKGTTDTLVNGVYPKEKIGGTFKTVLEQDDNGITHFAGSVVRKHGERSAVHYMTYTVTSCVVKGQATMVLDGSDPITYKAGSCYNMPAGSKGYIVNHGKYTLHLIDINAYPQGKDSMVMLEG